MDKNEFLTLREQIRTLPPDIAENQEFNKSRIFREHLTVQASVGKDNKISKLDDLLYMKYHYFESGFFCPYTPEQLQDKILKELDKLIEEK
jgi:hypothetical protein